MGQRRYFASWTNTEQHSIYGDAQPIIYLFSLRDRVSLQSVVTIIEVRPFLF